MLKVTGVDLYSAGDIAGAEGSEELVLLDRRGGVYKRLVLEGDRVTGAVLYGDVQDGPWYFGLIQDRTDISSIRNQLLFGQSLCLDAA
jgi:nitrite reductase (NADH) large subunit